MSSGERPIGAAKGKKSDTEALCQTSPQLHRPEPEGDAQEDISDVPSNASPLEEQYTVNSEQ